MHQIDSIELSLVCPEYIAPTRPRTFKAPCGSYLRFKVNPSGTIRSFQRERMYCEVDCPECERLEISARELLTREAKAAKVTPVAS